MLKQMRHRSLNVCNCDYYIVPEEKINLYCIIIAALENLANRTVVKLILS